MTRSHSNLQYYKQQRKKHFKSVTAKPVVRKLHDQRTHRTRCAGLKWHRVFSPSIQTITIFCLTFIMVWATTAAITSRGWEAMESRWSSIASELTKHHLLPILFSRIEGWSFLSIYLFHCLLSAFFIPFTSLLCIYHLFFLSQQLEGKWIVKKKVLLLPSSSPTTQQTLCKKLTIHFWSTLSMLGKNCQHWLKRF